MKPGFWRSILHPEDALWGRDGAEIAARAKACGAVGILCAAGDGMNAAAINTLSASGSMSFPKSDTRPRFRAISPSK